MFCTSGQLLSVHVLINTGGSFGHRALVSPSLHVIMGCACIH
ncbi:mCG1048375 [Mus musculus]|nr:mCG1048375 [Mus musculus]